MDETSWDSGGRDAFPTPQHRQFVCVCRSGQTGVRGSKDCAAWRYLDGGHAPAVEHQEPITVGGAKHAGVFREGSDESLDDLSLVAVILKRDVELVTAHQANPQLYFCHKHAPCLVASAQSRGHPPLCKRRPRPANQHRVESVERGEVTQVRGVRWDLETARPVTFVLPSPTSLNYSSDPEARLPAMSMDHTNSMFFEDDNAFAAWLVDNASTASHVWMRMAKKGTGVTSIDWTTAVDVALCFGWIDGIARRLDEEWYVQRFTPRRARSVWSKINCERIERLTAEGRMRPGGLAEVERAKADGRWDAAYDSPATAVVPDDLAAALAVRGLTDVYAALDGRNRFAFLNRIQTAVRPETRTRRIEQLTDALAQGKTPYPAPTKKSGT